MADQLKDLVPDGVIDNITKLTNALAASQQQLIDTAAAAAMFTNNINGTKTVTAYTEEVNKATSAMKDFQSADQKVTQQHIAANKAMDDAVEAVKKKALADADASKVLQQVGGTLDANIKLLVQQKTELANVTAQQKELSKAVISSTASQEAQRAKMAELTKQQLLLKESISQNSLVIRQQVRDIQASGGSQDQQLARLNQLRKAYNSLTDEERNNAQIGGVLKQNIDELSASTTKINEEQGKWNDSVGKYESAIKSALAQYVPFGRQIVQGVDALKASGAAAEESTSMLGKLGFAFGGFTIGAFATVIAGATYYLSQFRDTGNQVQQFLGGLKNQFSNFFGNLLNSKNPFSGFVTSFNQGVDVTKQLQDVKNLNEVNEQLIAKQQGQADQYRAMAKDVKLSSDERLNYLKKSQQIEKDILDEQKDNAQANIAAGIAMTDAVKKLDPAYKQLLQIGGEGSIRLANDLVKQGKITEAGYKTIMDGYQRQTQAMNFATMKLIREQNDEAKLDMKDTKQLTRDKLELQKAELEGEKLNAKLIVDDEKQTYEARYAALQVYIARSKSLIENNRQTANLTPNISGFKIKANNQTAKNQDTGVDLEAQELRKKIADDELKDLQKQYEVEMQLTKSHDNDLLKEILETSAKKAQINEDNASDAELALAQQRAKGVINEREYQQGIKDIQHQSIQDTIADTIAGLKQIVKLKKDAGLDTAEDQKKIDDLQRRATQENTNYQLTNLKTIQQEKQEAIKVELGLLNEVFNASKQVAEDIFKVQEQRVQRQMQLLDDQTQAERNAINNSLGSAKEKAAKTQLLDEQSAQKREQLRQRENAIKRKAAIAEKAAAVASILINTQIAASKVEAQTGIFGIPLVAFVIAQGAIETAAVLAQPLPQYAKGTDNSKRGLAIVGELGTELMIDPSGKMSLTPNQPSLTYLQAGTKIINNTELTKMVNNPQSLSDERIVKELQKMQRGQSQSGTFLTDKGLQGYNKSGATITQYLRRNGINR